MKRPETSTLVLTAVAVGSIALAHADPWADDGPTSQLVSTKSSAWRLFPEMEGRGAEGATIELRPIAGDPVRIVPDGSGHAVEAAGRWLGPADPEAVDGLWASLRMATTLRAVSDDAPEIAERPHGVIAVELDGARHEVWIGEAAPDGAGVYGGRRNAPAGIEGTWVVERELDTLLAQSPRAWIAHRAMVVEPAQARQVHFADGLTLAYRDDGTWRSELDGQSAILEPTAVEHRLTRLFSARLDPWVDAEVDIRAAPAVQVATEDGRTLALWRGGACPGREGRVVVARGPGLRGCLDEALLRPWPAVGRGTDDDDALLDVDLLPVAYGRVLRIEVEATDMPTRVLARHGGGWRIEETLEGRELATEVDESEVYRWFSAAHDAEVALAAAPVATTPVVSWLLSLDSGTRLTLRCVGMQSELRCRRDDGPWLSIRTHPPVLTFDAETFVDRKMVEATPDDVRAVEILAASGSTVARQSAHFDLGVWRLDAPEHPAGDDALDVDALQALMAAATGLRADQWLESIEAAPERIVRLELTPRRDRPSTVDLTVWSDCRVQAPGRRPARISEGTCASLRGNLLRSDAAAHLLLAATSVELTVEEGETVRLLDDEGSLRREDDAPLGPAAGALSRLRRFVADAVVDGPPPTPAQIEARIRPRRGAAYTLRAGEGWVSVAGNAWHYRGRLADPDDATGLP